MGFLLVVGGEQVEGCVSGMDWRMLKFWLNVRVGLNSREGTRGIMGT